MCDFGERIGHFGPWNHITQGGVLRPDLAECCGCEALFHRFCAGVDTFHPGWLCFSCW